MNIWDYCDISKQPSRYFKTWDCPFCNTNLSSVSHRANYESPTDSFISTETFRNTSEELFLCRCCGWWRLEERTFKEAVSINETLRGTAANLKALDLCDLSLPIETVRNYLLANYESRFEVHPRVFEETVASVFRDHGYQALVTGYTGDGGIDIVLHQGDNLVGVQVKRYRGSIEVEQIRSFAGALVLAGITKGVFVTTSRFQKGCETASREYGERNIKIELANSDQFYSALGLAQVDMERPIDTFDLERMREELTVIEIHNEEYPFPT